MLLNRDFSSTEEIDMLTLTVDIGQAYAIMDGLFLFLEQANPDCPPDSSVTIPDWHDQIEGGKEVQATLDGLLSQWGTTVPVS